VLYDVSISLRAFNARHRPGGAVFGPQCVAARQQPLPPDGATATLLPDGTVLILGGERDRSPPTARAAPGTPQQSFRQDSEEAFRSAAVAGSRLKRCLPRGIVSAFRAAKYRFLVDESAPRMLMFGMDRDEVISLIHRGGGRIVTIRPDQSHGTEVAGFEYWVSK
jgi:hypothetical protein